MIFGVSLVSISVLMNPNILSGSQKFSFATGLSIISHDFQDICGLKQNIDAPHLFADISQRRHIVVIRYPKTAAKCFCLSFPRHSVFRFHLSKICQEKLQQRFGPSPRIGVSCLYLHKRIKPIHTFGDNNGANAAENRDNFWFFGRR